MSVRIRFGNLRFLVIEFLNMLEKRHVPDLYFFSRKLFPLIRCIYQKLVNPYQCKSNRFQAVTFMKLAVLFLTRTSRLQPVK